MITQTDKEITIEEKVTGVVAAAGAAPGGPPPGGAPPAGGAPAAVLPGAAVGGGGRDDGWSPNLQSRRH